ncbi:hypothetical protein [Glaciimonas soli]|uniref:Uncharacterized protein n=1 Tax=Glaciimonas soli TaxID=2590999 RepID=A0A843YQE4_9BURK|nr:hypothetical protein [Glaciimonas soli]MQQ99742.1 hypothetical protein [Glaciimonas soli]
MQSLDLSTIHRRIAVDPPYFAFKQLTKDDDGTVYGDFVPEQAMGYECGLVSAAELGRHLAILGSCAAAAALPHDERVYYLAMKAHYIALRQEKQNAQPEQVLHALAKIIPDENGNARTLKSFTSASDNETFATLLVEYSVLPEKLFKRMFSNFSNNQVIALSDSPYKQSIPLRFDKASNTGLIAHSSALEPDQCAGHFSGYPAWPVAIIAYSLLQVAGKLFHHVIGAEEKYAIHQVKLDVKQLISSSDPLSFQAEFIPTASISPRYTFQCKVIHQQKTIVELEVEIDRLS